MNIFSKIWELIKRQWKKIAGVAVIGTAIAAGTVLTPDKIPDDYLLKATLDKILESQEVDWIERQPDGTFINKGKIVKYDYISDKEVGQVDYGKLKEEISLRNGNTQFFKKSETPFVKGKKTETWVAKVYAGTPFWEVSGKWYQVETATTTIDAFQKQTKVSFLEKTFGVYAISTTTYSGAGDGGVSSSKQATWAAAYTNAGSFTDYTGVDVLVGSRGNDAPPYIIDRTPIPFYTAGIAGGSTISSSTVFINLELVIDTDNDGDDYLAVVETFQTSTSTLQNDDFVDVGYDTGNETGGRAANANIVEGSNAVNISGRTGVMDFQVNASGLGWIKTADQNSTCGSLSPGWSCLGLREGHDLLNHDIVLTKNSWVLFYTFEKGGNLGPYMTIEYTVAVVAEPDQFNVILFE